MKIKPNTKKYSFLLIISVLILMNFFVGHYVWGAGDSTITNTLGVKIAQVLGNIIAAIIYAIGLILTALIGILIWVAEYNDFIKSPAVSNGWSIVRDICNMLFILILLIIAFATILRMESYNWKKMLPKLLIMAVLINFSKTICGIFIDFAQVIMLTFVNGFRGMGGSNLVEMLGINKILSINPDVDTKITTLSVFGSYMLGLIYVLISVVVVTVMIAVLVMRMVMLWIYIVLSPLAYLLSAFPQGQKYASQWWGEFSKLLITGPVLAFFIWLSFVSASSGLVDLKSTDGTLGTIPPAAATQAGSYDNMIKFIISIGMLVGGLMITQQIGGAAGGIAGKGMAAIQKGKGLAWSGVKGGADFLNRKQALKTGYDFNPARQFARVKASFDRSKKEDFRGMQSKANDNLRRGGIVGGVTGFAANDWADNYLRGFLGIKGLQQVFQGGVGNVGKLREKQGLVEWKAKNISDQVGFEEKVSWLERDRDEAKSKGDDETAKEKDEELNKLRNNRSDLVFESIEEQNRRKDVYSKQALNFENKANRLTIQDYEGKAEAKAAIAEQGKKIDSTNEDELIADFQKAMSHNNVNLAAAIAKSLVKVGGFNTLLGKYGYNAKAGLTEDEIGQFKKAGRTDDEIKEMKGVNDFMRDVFQKRLRMNEHDALTLQSDLGSLAETTSHAYLTKTVGVNLSGEFYQSGKLDRESSINVEHRKSESEKWARNNNRTYYGGENLYKDGRFEWSESGLTKVIDGISIISKEIVQDRFNPSSAKAFIEPYAFEILKDTLAQAVEAGVVTSDSFHKDFQVPGDAKESMNKFFKGLENYANSMKKENINAVGKIVNKTLSNK